MYLFCWPAVLQLMQSPRTPAVPWGVWRRLAPGSAWHPLQLRAIQLKSRMFTPSKNKRMTNTETHAAHVATASLKWANIATFDGKNQAATGAAGSRLRVPGWRADVGFCTSNEAQATCDTFRYLLLRSDWRALSHMCLVSTLWLNEFQRAVGFQASTRRLRSTGSA